MMDMASGRYLVFVSALLSSLDIEVNSFSPGDTLRRRLHIKYTLIRQLRYANAPPKNTKFPLCQYNKCATILLAF